MAVSSTQNTLSTTAEAVFQGFNNVSGAVSDPLPASIKNIDAAITIYLGGPGVTSGNGYPLLAGQSIMTTWLQQEITTLYAVAASGTPILAILTARQ